MFSPLFVVETWLLTEDGSQFQQRGENVSLATPAAYETQGA